MDKQTFTTKLYEVCSNDSLRPILMCVHFNNGFAYASDAHMVIKQSLDYHTILEKELLEGKSIHMDNYKAIMGFETAKCTEKGVECKDSDGRVAFYEYFDRGKDGLPNFDEILKPQGLRPVEFIGINPEYLYKLRKAIHAPNNALRLQFQGVDKGILIDCPEIENRWAILIPALLSDNLFNSK